ncbi:hypothetical protein LguiA_002240 [Lonicera macranthoides]
MEAWQSLKKVRAAIFLYPWDFKFCLKLQSSETFNNQEMEGSSTVPSDIAYTDDHVLVFFEGMNWTFELGDIFKAEAEKLGMGTYKAKLKDSTILVVNRFKEHRVMK